MTQESFILLEDTKRRGSDVRGYLYEKPEYIIDCTEPGKLAQSIEQLQAAAIRGYHLAGWMAYECGYALEPRLQPLLSGPMPCKLMWFGVFTDRREMRHPDLEHFWREKVRSPLPNHTIFNQRLSVDKARYLAAIERIHSYLKAGDIYQVNYTIKNRFDFEGDTASLYRQLRASQPVEYSAYIQTPDATILSFSPELFVRKDGLKLNAKPMKGTAARGFLLADDINNRQALVRDEKSRAENLMILDLLRNDLSRLARPGTVRTTKKFEVEAFRTLLQMTSSVEAELPENTSLLNMFKALFPCGSITGAPKIRAMEIIHELEQTPRGIYTGAIGYITPELDFCFSVPIRTISVTKKDGGIHGEMGIGGGIVADSAAEAEFEECLLKARFATHPMPSFDLIETMRWQPDAGYVYLQEHLARLENSAIYFDFSYPAEAILNALEIHAESLDPAVYWRVRLLLSPEGTISITSAPLSLSMQTPPLVAVSDQRIDSANVLLYHKTTRREFYEDELAQLSKATGCFEVIFLNERGEVSEGARTNIFIEKDGKLFTPTLTCGLLPGILRGRLLGRENNPVHEAILTMDDLISADRVYVGNSLRGLIEVRLITDSNT